MAIMFGSPEALEILKADKKLEKAMEMERAAMLTVAAFESRARWPRAKDLVNAQKRVEAAQEELNDAEDELADIERKLRDDRPEGGAELQDIDQEVWEMWQGLPPNLKDVFFAEVKVKR